VYHYIYKHSAVDIFSENLLMFHTECVDSLIMTGVGDNTDNIQDVKMTMLGNPLAYCRRIVGGLMNVPGLFHVVCENEDSGKYAECYIAYILDDELVEDYYMLQNIYDYPRPGKCSFQIWRLKLVEPKYINILWRA
jgi:hypothetical protein